MVPVSEDEFLYLLSSSVELWLLVFPVLIVAQGWCEPCSMLGRRMSVFTPAGVLHYPYPPTRVHGKGQGWGEEASVTFLCGKNGAAFHEWLQIWAGIQAHP